MSGAPANPLNRSRMRRLLAAVGSAPVPEAETQEVREYDWRDPHYFQADHLNRLTSVMGQAAGLIAGCFAHFYSREFDAHPESITQHFADALSDGAEGSGGYSLPFGPSGRPPCGFLRLEQESALGWVARLLGDSESASDSDRSLSSLERSLLSDLMVAIVEAFLTPIRSETGLDTPGELCEGPPTLQFERTEAVCRVVVRVGQAGGDEESDLVFLLPCHQLAPLVGKTVENPHRHSPQELSQILMEHVQQMPVTITARLATTTLSFQETADLECGDILLLEKPTDSPMELVMNGRTILRGRPARQGGRYAALVTESARANVQDTSNQRPKG